MEKVFQRIPFSSFYKIKIRELVIKLLLFVFKRLKVHKKWRERKIKEFKNKRKFLEENRSFISGDSKKWCIITSKENYPVAKMISKRLKYHERVTDITTKNLSEFKYDWYIALYPQKYKILPPKEKTITFILSKLPPNKSISKYLIYLLTNSSYIIENNIENIFHLKGHGIKFLDIYYVPVDMGHKKFSFMFDRFLVAVNFLPASMVKSLDTSLSPLSKRVVISLPETVERNKRFQKIYQYKYESFEGVRRYPEWVGCGLSFYTLAIHAIKNKINRMEIMEDDVVLPENFEKKVNIIYEFLDLLQGKWDIFSGMISDIDRSVKILYTQNYKNINFIIVNKMNSMVFNIYSQKFMKKILSWDYNNLDFYSNTIDRYLSQQKNLRIVTTVPFLFGHDNHQDSILWGCNNEKLYMKSIEKSYKILKNKSRQYEKNKMEAKIK